MRHNRFILALAALSALCLAGCGYTTKSSLDPKYRTIAVSPFYDESREYDLQAPLTNAVIRKFLHDGRLDVVTEKDADLILEGKILNYKLKGLTYQKDETTQFIVVITAAVRLREVQSGTTLWEEPVVAGETTYYTRAAGQSSDRLRGNAETFLPTVRSFASEEENRAASEALEQLASDIFYRVVEPW